MLAAARAVAVEVALARALGGDSTRVLEGCPVRRIDLDADRPTLVTDAGRITADRLIVTAGAWTRRLFPGPRPPLQPTRQLVLYFRPADPAPFEPGRFPVFIYKGPGHGRRLLRHARIPRHGREGRRGTAGPTPTPTPRSGRSPTTTATSSAVPPRTHPRARRGADRSTEVCLYTVAPDERFLVDLHPGRRDVIVASPCSGHGFKFSCLIGRILADLAVQGETAIDITPWRSA